MADPTQKNREAVKGFFKSILPANSPLMQSSDSTLTPEALAEIEAKKKAVASIPVQDIQTQEPSEFVNPAQPQEAQERSPSAVASPQSSAIDTYKNGLNSEANTLDQIGKQQANAYGDLSEQNKKLDDQIQDVRTNEQKAFAAFEKEDAETRRKIDNFEIEPKSFFAGKSTWQKILGGVGMFLGSITPEGARNVAGIIEKEIDRDIDIQKQQFALLKDKRSDTANRYKMKMDMFGNDKLAMMSMKKDALMATELQLKKIESSAKGPLARSKATQGLATIQMSQEALSNKMMIEYAKLQKEQNKGAISGYRGTIEDPTAARDFRTAAADAPLVAREVNNLLSINKKFLGGALSSDARASAAQSQKLLVGKMRLALVGPGSMSEGDRTLMEEAIANPTDFFSLGSSNEIKLKKLLGVYNDKLESDARVYGLEKVMPNGARKIN